MRAPRSARPTAVVLSTALVLGLGVGAAALGRAQAAPVAEPGPADAAPVAALPAEDLDVLGPVATGDAPTDTRLGPVVGRAEVALPVPDAPTELPELDLTAPPVPAPAVVLAALGPVPSGEVAVPDVTHLGAPGPAPSGDAPGTPPVPASPDTPAPGPDVTEDPCAAPVGGAGAEADDGVAACPEGIRTTVLASTAPPELSVFTFTDPPRWAEGDGGRRPVAHCSPDLSLAPDEALVAVVANAPGDVRLDVWSTSLEGPGPTVSFEVRTSDADARRWHEDLEAGRDLAEGWVHLQHCVVVDGLEPDVRYGLRAQVIDDFGRTAAAGGTLTLPASAQALAIPPSRVIPLTTSRVLATVAHRADQHVDVRAWGVEPGSPATCTPPAGARQLWSTPPVVAEVPAEQLERRGQRPTYDRRTNLLVGVPEGATVVVCLRWFDSQGPSWDWERPESARAVVLDTPDLLTPVIRLARLDLTRSVEATSVRLDVSVGGFGCGGWSGPDAAGSAGSAVAPDAVLCDPTAGGAWLDQGLDRNARVEVSHRPQGGERVSTRAVLRTAARTCTPGCAVPATQWYRLPLPSVRVSSGLCGGSGDCTPPTTENTLGSLLLRVDFVRGSEPVGDRSRWSASDLVDVTETRVAPEAPQLDTFASPVVTGPRSAPRVEMALTADRPVTWSARWTGCTVDDAPSLAQAPLSTAARLVLTGVCPGHEGAVEVTLTAPDGSTSTWGRSREEYGEGFWARGILWVPGTPTLLDVNLEAVPDRVVLVDSMQVVVDGRPVAWPRTAVPCATRSGARQQSLGTALELPPELEVVVTVALRPAESYAGAGPDTCGAAAGTAAQVVTFRGTVTLAELLAGEVTLAAGPTTDPAAAFPVTLRLRATP